MFLDDLVLARQHVRPVDFQPADLESQLGAVFEMVVNLSVMQQHLGRNATDVQASSAQVGIFLNHYRFQAKFACPDGRHIATRTASDNRHIVLCHS